MAKKRLDVLLFEKGLCPSRERAKTAIMEGIVYIAGQKAGKAGDMVDETAELEVRGNENAFVSRGGKKIEKALNYFNIDPTDLVVMDVGASTGGFTDCLLRRGSPQSPGSLGVRSHACGDRQTPCGDPRWQVGG